MKLTVTNSYEKLSELAAEYIAAQVILKPDSVLGLATGSSPVGVYKCLVEKFNKGCLDFSDVISINLDEYVGLDGSHEQSYRYFMQDHLFNYVNIKPENTFVPNGCASDLAAECSEYDARVTRLGGIDLQLLGIGPDGHIGFNEPDDHFTAETHVVDLLPSTIEANSRFFSSIDEVPKQAVSMGMGSIMKAKKIILLANGKAKHQAIKELLDDRITTSNPSTLLKVHPDTVIICDKEAYEG